MLEMRSNNGIQADALPRAADACRYAYGRNEDDRRLDSLWPDNLGPSNHIE